MTPWSRQPQSAAIHSGRFSAQKTTVSPFLRPAASSRAAKARAARATSAYVCSRRRKPLSWTRNSPRRLAKSSKKSSSVSRRIAWSMIPAVPNVNLPPALAVGALYDSFLQAALRQFFARATFETEPMLSASSDGRLAIEPTDDPVA